MTHKKLAHYKILDKLGAGGMGEVFRAEDTKLGRQVAIKVLPEIFVDDPERMARFDREAKMLASLNHPNIAAIYGLEEAEGKNFLIMELVEGETLAQKLEKGAMSIEDSLDVCIQIAEGIEAAHEKDIIHRDLKPANVKITPEGKVKVLDFGLAKALFEEETGSSLIDSPTLTAQMTQPGVILGTAPYMSPEQAKGKAVDKRTDIWAFGCILYECLTGNRAFKGDTVSETMASILKDEPDWKILPKQLPSQVRSLLFRCLQKNPEQRPRDIRDIKLEVAEFRSFPVEEIGLSELGKHPSRRKTFPLTGILTTVVLIAVAAGIAIERFWLRPGEEKPASASVSFSINLPKEQHVRFFRDNPFIAISPDGKRIAWIGETGRIFTRELHDLEVREVSGTEGLSPYSPVVFSPDGLMVGFIRDNSIWEVPVQGGVPRKLYGDESMTDLYSFTWGDDGTLILHLANSALMRLSPGDDQAEYITTLEKENKEFTHLFPTLLPRNKGILFAVAVGNYGNQHIEVLSFETGERQRLIEDSFMAFYSPTGHLIHVRDETLYAVPFDLEKLELTGQEVPILSDIQMNTVNHWIPGFSLSNNGTIVYIPANQGFGEYQLAWINPNNQINPLPGIDGFIGRPTISPDGKKIAYQSLQGHYYQIFVYDLDRQVSNQFTSEGYSLWPVWSPDGENIVFSSGRNGQMNLFIKPIAGGQPSTIIRESPFIQIPTSWYRDGDILAYIERDEVDIRNVWLLSMNDPNSPPTPLLNTSAHEGSAKFSPVGKLIVYSSNEQGQEEIFVKEFSFDDQVSGNKEKVSRNGGRDPIWARDGSELFFRSLDERKLLKVSIETNPLRIGDEQVLFEQPKFLRTDWVIFFGIYDVSLDGNRFLAVLEKEAPDTMELVVVTNWFEKLKKKAARGK